MRALITAAATAVVFPLATTAPTEVLAEAKITVRPNSLNAAVLKCKADNARLYTYDGRVFAVGECWRRVGMTSHTD